MKSYMLKEGAVYAIVPGHGKLYPGQTIVGDYDALVPGTLRVVPTVPAAVEAPSVSPAAASAPKVAVPAPVAPVLVEPEPKREAPLVQETTGALHGDSAVSESDGAPSEPEPEPEAKAVVDLPPSDTTPKATTSSTVAGPQPPKGGKGSRR